MKAGAFIEDAEGHRLDVNTDYLFDPKMSTYVLVPKNAKLRVISPKAIRSVYIVADNRVMVTYNGWEYGAKLISGANTELKSYFVELDGTSNIIDIYSFDKTKDVKIYYITFQEINITMDVSTHIASVAGATTERILLPTRSMVREISDINKAFYKLEPIVEPIITIGDSDTFKYTGVMPISVLKFQGKNTIIFFVGYEEGVIK